MTIEVTKSVKATPFGMSLNANTATGVAWDNFDRFVETKSGKHTLHDTVGIAYQVLDNSRPNILENSQEGQNSNENTKLKKRKRSYSPSELTITPYRKKPKFVAHGMLELNDLRRLKYEKICDGISSPQKYNFLRMADFMFNDNYTTPMWVGWNAKYSPQNKTTQKIWYLPQIKQSSTSTSVVAETMRRSLRIASEGQKENISVTYDLAIAKSAMQIQAEEKPTFDKILISLESFHLEMAFLLPWEKSLNNQVVLIFWMNVQF